MRYLVAFFCPPLAVLSCRVGLAGVLNGIIWVAAFPAVLVGVGFFLWLVTAIHACLVVSEFYGERRARELKQAMHEVVAAAAEAAATASHASPGPAAPPAVRMPANYDAEHDVYRL